MKKIILVAAALSLIFLPGCRKTISAEKALSGTHPITVNHSGYAPSTNSHNTQGYSYTGEGTMKISKSGNGNGVYVTIRSSLFNIDMDLGVKTDREDGSIRYQPSAYTQGQMPPYLEYTPGDGKFRYDQIKMIGQSGSESYEAEGQL